MVCREFHALAEKPWAQIPGTHDKNLAPTPHPRWEGKPQFFKTDQGSQFSSASWIDNSMIERLRRFLNYECIYLDAFETGSEAKAGIGRRLAYHNVERPHSSHRILTPNEVHVCET